MLHAIEPVRMNAAANELHMQWIISHDHDHEHKRQNVGNMG